MAQTILVAFAVCWLALRPAAAQDATAYIQIEAQPSLARAEERLRDYATYLQDLNGFALGSGWYGIALGPYARGEAEALLRRLRGQGRIPRDSYIAVPGDYGRQFWPVGAAFRNPGDVTAPSGALDVPPVEEPVAQPALPDETPREARANERLLTRAERETLQTALQWAGFYNSAIDGAFGRGTRAAMADWQAANGFEVTGILTTAQRAALLRQYNSVLDGLGMSSFADERAGIRIDLPLGAVRFDRYEAPFALFEPTGDLPVRVLLISQPGDRDTLWGLYEIMQTLEIVPVEGPRERQRGGFVLTGANERIVSHTEARLQNGQIKGFSLIWPAGDEKRRSRVLALMQQSFTTFGGTLDPGAVSDQGQSVDLVSGLRIRTPKATASGFFIDRSGAVLTSAAAVAACGRVTLDDSYAASVVAQDRDLGLAVLRPDQPLAPSNVAIFRPDAPRLQSEIAVSGYSFGGVLTAPTLTFGTLEDLRGLRGEEGLKRLALASLPGDAGGPVLDSGGSVVGMLLPRDETGRQLPDDVSFAAKTGDILGFLRSAGIEPQSAGGASAMAPEDLTRLATGMTVLVGCWE